MSLFGFRSDYLTDPFRDVKLKISPTLAIKLKLAGFQDLSEILFNSEYENSHDVRLSSSKRQNFGGKTPRAQLREHQSNFSVVGFQTHKETDRGRRTKSSKGQRSLSSTSSAVDRKSKWTLILSISSKIQFFKGTENPNWESFILTECYV